MFKLVRTAIVIILLAISAKGQPVASIGANKTVGCSPLTIQFNSTSSTGNPVSYLWDFGNGNTSTLANPGANFISPGRYTVKLTLTNALGTNTQTKTDYITVFAPPSANFTTSGNRVGCPPLAVNYVDQSLPGTAPILNWQWDFDDGGSSTQKNAQNTYTFSGNFNIKLVIRDSNGCQSTLTKTNFVQVTSPFNPKIGSSNPFSCNAPLTVNFYDSTTPLSNTYTYLWDFGDGKTSTLKNPSNTYSNAGSFNVKLKVFGPNGCIKELLDTSYVNAGIMKSDFTWDGDLCVPASLSMILSGKPQYLDGGTYRWYLNGSLISSYPEPTLSFPNPGSNQLKLLVISPDGICRDSITKTIVIGTKTKPSFIATPLTSCQIPLTVNFTDQTSSSASWLWNFGDNTYSTSKNPNKVYTEAGKYTISLKIRNQFGCEDELIKTEYVQVGIEKPVDLIINPKEGCKPLNVFFDFVDTNTIKYNQFFWTFGDGGTSSQKSNTRVYPNTGVYPITLKLVDINGCTYTITDSVRVGDKVIYTDSIPQKRFCFNEIDIDKLPPWKKGNQVPYDTIRDPKSPIATKVNRYYIKLPIGSVSQNLDILTDTGYYKMIYNYWYNGCMTADTSSDTIIIRGPIAKFDTLLLNKNKCRSDSIQFYNTSRDFDSTYWDFGDNDTAFHRVNNPLHVYKNGGVYNVKLKVFNVHSLCWDSISKIVKVKDKVVPNFKLKDSVGCQPFTTKVIDLTTGNSNVSGTIYYNYLFNNSIGYSSPEPIITIPTPGYVSATMTIDAGGCKTTIKKDSIAYVVAGSTSFTLTPNTGCPPLKVKVKSKSTTQFPITEIKWLWGTNDSIFGKSDTAQYTYFQKNKNTSDGSYSIRLVVKDSLGCSFYQTKLVTPTQPTALINHKQMDECGYDSVYFSANLSSGNNLKFKWMSNGSTLDSLIAFSNNFYINNLNHIWLIATDNNKCRDTAKLDLLVNVNTPDVKFDATPRVINCPGPPIYFSDKTVKGEYGLMKYDWSFGDNSRSQLKDPVKIYLLAGSYDVKLKVTDSLGCVGEKPMPGFIIVGGPKASYSFTPNKGCTPQKVTFTAFSKNVSKYEWDLADGTIDTGQTLTHIYTDPRIYIPTLAVTDTSGCKVGLPPIDTIWIRGLPHPDFESDQIKICKNTNVIFTDLLPKNTPVTAWKWGFNFNDTIYTRGPHTKSYPKAGKYSVVLYITDTSGCTGMILKDSMISVFDDTIPPSKPNIIRATVDDNSTVFMSHHKSNEEDFKQYTVFFDYDNKGKAQQNLVKRKQSDTLFYELGLNTLLNTYSYTMQTEDVCKNVSALSNMHTTVELKAKGIINAVGLQWTKYIGWDSVSQYYIYKINPKTHSNSFELIDSVDGKTLNYIDTNIFCFKPLYYRIKAIRRYPDFQFSWSDTAGAVPLYQTLLPSTQNIRATVINNSSVLLQWTKRIYKTPFSYVIYRSKNDENKYSLVGETSINDTQFVDTKVDVQNDSYTYITYLKDECGVLGPASNKAKSIVLKINITRDDMVLYKPTMKWNKYEEWNSGVEKYKVDFYVDSNHTYSQIGITQADVTELTHDYLNLNMDDYCYRITAYQKDSNQIVSESNIGCVNTEPRLFAPNAFTVTHDNLNEKFDVKGVFVKEYKLEIYNRWGQLLFTSYDMDNKWDGTYNNQAMPSDVYVYKAWGRGKKGKEISIQGNVTLLR